MKKIAIYVRKSVKADENSVSLEAQIDIIKKYFNDEEILFKTFIDDGFSGGNTNRPAFKEMMEVVLKEKFNVVACYKLDRIARNTLDFLTTFNTLKDNGIDLVCVEDNYDPRTPAGRMMMTLLASLAEMERENIKQRVSDSMLNLAKQGRWTGGTVPMGYKVTTIDNGKYLELKDKESVEYIYHSFINGKGITKLSREFNCDKKRISRILKNITYLKSSDTANKYLETKGYTIIGEVNGNGYLPYGLYKTINGKKVQNKGVKYAIVSKHTAIINLDTFIKAQERLKLFDGRKAPRISKKSFLAQMIRCSCGSNMTIVLGHKRKDGTRTEYFSCLKKCGNSYLDVINAENNILTLLKSSKFSDSIEKYQIEKYKRDKKMKNNLNKELKNKTKILNGLLEKLALADDSLTNIFLNKIEILNKEIGVLKNEIIEFDTNIKISDIKEEIKAKKEFLKDFIMNFDEFTLEEKQVIIRKIISYAEWKNNNLIVY